MTLRLQVPCDGPELTDVIIHNDGEMEFPDYDIEHDLVLAEMGEETTLCALVYAGWEKDPLSFICESGLIPIELVGRIMTSWCKEAINVTRDELTEMGCYKALVANSKACASFWTSKRPSVKRIYQTRIDIVNCWNKYVRINQPTIGHPSWAAGPRPLRSSENKTTEQKVIDVTINNTLFILDFLHQLETTGGVHRHPTTLVVGGKTHLYLTTTPCCTATKREIRDILRGDIFVKSDREILDSLMSLPEYQEIVDEKMFELVMKEIQGYER